MLVVLTQLDRFGAGPTDWHTTIVALDPDTVHRLVSAGLAENEQVKFDTTQATLTDGTELILIGTVPEIAEVINEPYRMLSE